MPDPIKKLKSHKFYGRTYKFVYKDPQEILTAEELTRIKQNSGLGPQDEIIAATDDNRAKKKRMIVSNKIEKDDQFELLKALCDEAMHALDSTTDNKVVDEQSRDFASFLWKCGYRRQTNISDSLTA